MVSTKALMLIFHLTTISKLLVAGTKNMVCSLVMVQVKIILVYVFKSEDDEAGCGSPLALRDDKAMS